MKYYNLGNTGVKLSAITLGAATFGSYWGSHWTLSKAKSAQMLEIAVDSGINAIDTANIYNCGESEKWLGEILANKGLRHKLLLSTKFGYCTDPNNPNSGGCSRVAMYQSVEKSLKRLQTDYVDILYLHLWDGCTAIEETLYAANDLINEGKVRYFALSNPTAWYFARAEIIGRQTNATKPVAVQLNYNLLSRHLEHDFSLLLELVQDTSLIAWGPLANGLLTGRYKVDLLAKTINGSGRMNNGSFTTGTLNHFQPHVPRVIEGLLNCAKEIGYSASQIALAWLLHNKLVSSVIIGVTSIEQLQENIAAASIVLEPEVTEYLNDLSYIPSTYPANYMEPDIQSLVHGPFDCTRN